MSRASYTGLQTDEQQARETEEALRDIAWDGRHRVGAPLADADRLRGDLAVLRRDLERARDRIAQYERREYVARQAIRGAVEQVRAASLEASQAAIAAGLYHPSTGSDAPLRLVDTPGAQSFGRAEAALWAALDTINEEERD